MSLELVCPAGTPAALRAAVDAGADTVYCGFRDCTNARNYPGLNFDPDEMAEGVVTVKDLRTGAQERIPRGDLAGHFAKVR